MGVLRILTKGVLAAVLLAIAGVAGPLAARPLALADFACSGGADTAEGAFDLSASDLDCSSARFDRRDRFVRARIDLTRAPLLPPGRLIWQTDPTSFDSMLILITYADGRMVLIDVDNQMAVRNWDANGNFWVAFNPGATAIRAIDVVVERPQAAAVFERMTIARAAEVSTANEKRRLLYVLICGMLLLPIIYDLLFYRILRERFMSWHMVMSLGTLGYVLFNSGLVFLLLPELPSHMRFAMIFVSTGIIVVGAVRFSILVLEPGVVEGRLARIETWLAGATLLAGLLMVLDAEPLRLRLATVNFLLLMAVVALGALLLAIAHRRGSRVARFLGLAFVGAMVAAVLQVFSAVGSPQGDHVLIDDTSYLALLVLVIGTSAGVGDRFLVIKSERDRARLTARKLGTMANTDGLTRLLNRRAFDQNGRLAPGQALLLADLDRFKQINDTYGHQRGDAVLCRAGQIISDVVAPLTAGTVYRLGGEEFAVLAPLSTREEVGDLCERIRAAIEQASGAGEDLGLPQVTLSIGAVLGTGQLMHVAFSDADEALYHAKESGRNRCHIAEV